MEVKGIMWKIKYLKCPFCHYVFPEKKMELHSFEDPCPNCKKSTGQCGRWPLVAIENLLEIAKNQKLNNYHEKVICIVFLCITLEALLEVVLYELIKTQKSKRDLQKIWGWKKKCDEYKRLSGCSLKEFLCSKGYNSFYDDWVKLVEARNKIVHGSFFSRIIENKIINDEIENRIINKKENKIINKISDNCLKVFVEVHNDIQRKKQTQSKKKRHKVGATKVAQKS